MVIRMILLVGPLYICFLVAISAATMDAVTQLKCISVIPTPIMLPTNEQFIVFLWIASILSLCLARFLLPHVWCSFWNEAYWLVCCYLCSFHFYSCPQWLFPTSWSRK
jgi:hypothetical protein